MVINRDNLPRSRVNGACTITHLTFDNLFNQGLSMDSLPNQLTHLVFGRAFNQPIGRRVLPQTLKNLVFGASFNQEIGKGILPSKLTHLELGLKFRQVLSVDALPATLTHLVHDPGYPHLIHLPISLVQLSGQHLSFISLPPLTHLTLSPQFSFPLTEYSLPQTLQHFVFGRNISVPLPKQLVSLEMAHDFNQQLEAGYFPLTLKSLTMGAFFDHPIPINTLPPSLTSLRLGDRFNTPIIPSSLPATLESLSFGTAFNQPILPDHLPQSLKHLQVGDFFNQPLVPGSLPNSLTHFTCTNQFQQILTPDIIPSVSLVTIVTNKITSSRQLSIFIESLLKINNITVQCQDHANANKHLVSRQPDFFLIHRREGPWEVGRVPIRPCLLETEQSPHWSSLFTFTLLVAAVLALSSNVNSQAPPACATTIGGESFFVGNNLCAWTYATGLNKPRQVYIASNGDVIVSVNGAVVVMFDTNGDGVIGTGETATLATQSGLTHGVTVFGGYLYATSASTVYRWPYTVGQRSSLGASQIVVGGMPTAGHKTRTVEFKPDGSFYLSIGSNLNLDPNSDRARVVLCNLNLNSIPSAGYDWTVCQVWADGCRNEVGLRLAANGQLWGVENGMDNLDRPDLAPKASTDNPCEEVNVFAQAGFYGYPKCFSEGVLPAATARGKGYQWGVVAGDDSWCNNTANVIKPSFCMEAHTAPLDIIFFNSNTFPSPWNTGVLVAQHGSWNRVPASGYQVIHIAQDPATGLPIPGSSTRIFGSAAATGADQKWGTRPVSLGRLAPCGPFSECLLVTSDASGTVIAIRSTLPPTSTTTVAPTTTTTTIAPTTTSTTGVPTTTGSQTTTTTTTTTTGPSTTGPSTTGTNPPTYVWTSTNIGATGIVGSSSGTSTSVITVKASGADIYNAADQFFFVHQPAVTSTASIKARVVSVVNTNVWAKAGVMFRESIAAGSKYVGVYITPGKGVSFQYRSTTNANAINGAQVTGIVAPYHVKLTRSGNSFTAQYSSNGSSWTTIGTCTVTMPNNALEGLALTSHNNAQLSTAVFDQIILVH
eukprot:gene13826-16298_t